MSSLLTNYPVFWLLAVAVSRRVPLVSLLPYENDEEDYYIVVFNRLSHGLRRDELMEQSGRLFEGGFVRAWRLNEDQSPWDAALPGAFRPSRSLLERVFDSAQGPERHTDEISRLCYGLTKKGGTLWEKAAQPNWNAFIDFEEEVLEPEQNGIPQQEFRISDSQGSLSGKSLPIGRSLLLRSRTVAVAEAHFAHDRDVFGVADPSTVKWEKRTPWHATYWKRFPTGHQVSYSLWPENELASRGAAVATYAEMDERFAGRLFAAWHSEPAFDSPE